MAKTHEEWYVGIRFKMDKDEKKWTNARFYYPGVISLADKYCKTEKEANAVLEFAYNKFNRQHGYNMNGERYETSEAAPGIGIATVIAPELDDALTIVEHVIKKRTVTDWETIA